MPAESNAKGLSIVFEEAAVDVESFQKRPFLPAIISMIAYFSPLLEACWLARDKEIHSIKGSTLNRQKMENFQMSAVFLPAVEVSFPDN